MRIRISDFGLCIIALCILLGTAGAQDSSQLSLDEAIKTALKNNRQFLIAQQNVEKAEDRVREAAGAGHLKVDGSATYQRFDKVAKASFGNAQIQLGNIDSKTARISVVQPIDISGTIRSGVRTASLGLEAAQLEYERAKNDLILSVTNAYEGVARAQAFVVVAEEALKNSQERLRITQVQLDTGVAAQFDLLRAQTQVAQNEQAVIGARNTLDLAKANLNNILGRDLSHPVQIEEQSSLPPMEQELDALVQTAMQMRPEVQAAEKNIQIANRNIFNAKRGILPNLALSGQMDFNFNTSTFNPRNSSFTALAVLSVPVMDGGVTDARVEQARSDLKIAQITAAQIKEGVALEVRNAFLNLRDAKQKLEVAERGIAQATEGLRLARVRFEAGVSTPLEISDAEVAYTQAQTNRVNARYDYLNAYAALQRATGKIGERYL